MTTTMTTTPPMETPSARSVASGSTAGLRRAASEMTKPGTSATTRASAPSIDVPTITSIVRTPSVPERSDVRRLIVVGMLLLVAGLTAGTGGGTDDVRTIDVTMTDDLRYDPDELRVSAGETVRFVIRNAGADVHQFLVGTAEEQAVFAQEMADGHGGGHAEPVSA